MKFPLFLRSFVVLALLATGCATKDPLTRFYQAVQNPTPGPVGTGPTFVTMADGMTVYHTLPPVPYYIIGRFDRPIGMGRIATAAKYYGADFIYVADHEQTVISTDPGLILAGNNTAVTLPGKSRAESRLGGLVYLGVTNLSHIKIPSR